MLGLEGVQSSVQGVRSADPSNWRNIRGLDN